MTYWNHLSFSPQKQLYVNESSLNIHGVSTLVVLFWDTMVIPEDLNPVVAGFKAKKAE